MLKDDIRLVVLEDRLNELTSRLVSKLVRNDAAGDFDESKHPRDADGKFSKGSGQQAAVEAYKKTLKPGKKGTASGLIKHLLLGGKTSSKDIFLLAKEHYGAGSGSKNVNGKAYVNYYINELKKAGENVPPPPEESAGETATSKAPELPAPGPPANAAQTFLLSLAEEVGPDSASKISELSSQVSKLHSKENIEYGKKLIEALKGSGEASSSGEVPTPTKKTPQEQIASIKNIEKKFAYHYHPEYGAPVANAAYDLVNQWTSFDKSDQDAVFEGIEKLSSALEGADKLKAVASIPSMKVDGSPAKKMFNKLLKKVVEAEYADSKKAPQKAASSPLNIDIGPSGESTPEEKKVYEVAKDVPHYRNESVSYLEDASGKEVRAKLAVDTKKIHGDFYAEVSSAYGPNASDGNTRAVGKAMQSYWNHIQNNVLDHDQKVAALDYKGHLYKPINKAVLNEDNASPEMKKRIKDLRAAIKSTVVPANTPVFRGLSGVTLEKLSGFKEGSQAVGRCFEHPSFASVSRDVDVAKSFGEDVLLSFTIPAGAPGLTLGRQVDGGENEIVLPDKGIFRIDRVETFPHPYNSKKQRHKLHVTYMGTREDD